MVQTQVTASLRSHVLQAHLWKQRQAANYTMGGYRETSGARRVQFGHGQQFAWLTDQDLGLWFPQEVKTN